MRLIPEVTKPFLSFSYAGKNFLELISEGNVDIQKKEGEQIDHYDLIYRLPGGLKVIQSVDVYKKYQAAYWVNYFENTGESDTEIISSINDCDLSFAFDYDPPTVAGYIHDPNAAKIIRTIGSDCTRDEWHPKEEWIFPDQSYTYSCVGGRSSQGLAPFFDVNRGEKGVLIAIGWTGQWKAQFARSQTHINIKTGIEETYFKLLPGEKIRTSSALVLPYENGTTKAHIDFKRIIKEHLSLIGKEGWPKTGPLCTMGWGSVHTDKMLQRIDGLTRNDLGFEYYWIDAGWYGNSTTDCPNEFVGDWGSYTGDWSINKNYHPDELEDVAKLIHERGLKFLLWIEPERCLGNTLLPSEHPDWFIRYMNTPSEWLRSIAMLNLGNEEALNATIDLVAGFIEKLGLSCYRQDFNMDPLEYWRENDEPDRRGIHEIKHIMGLYRFWDALLARFPGLIIDNCASGGKRIDIETLQRSMPMWRSDYQCCWDREAECAQCHSAGISRWVPYSGTGVGVVKGDLYRMRSSYGSSLSTNYWGYGDMDFKEDEPIDIIRAHNEEFKRVRPYMSCDFYPIIPLSIDDVSWGGWQFNRPEESDGVVLAFRRPQSPFDTVTVFLEGLEQNKIYCFQDADTGEKFNKTQQELSSMGLILTLPEKRSSKLYFYNVL